MEKHEKFAEWVLTQGVKINGIAVSQIPGKGLGIIAKKKHEVGSKLINVPRSALRTAYEIPKSISDPIGPITIHGLLACDLALDTSSATEPWRNVLPTQEDFQESMPLMWDTQLQALLPARAFTFLTNQKTKLALDWPPVHSAFPSLTYTHYCYCWLIINTRTFYFTSSSRKIPKPTNLDDCLALNPFADYFNHTDVPSCTVDIRAQGYEIIANRVIEKGEEIYISYGGHCNDFLLAEYGFILEENKWDEVSLDLFILPLLSEKQKAQLEEARFLGKYVLDREDVCYRTQVALRVLCFPARKWQRFLNGFDDGKADQVAINQTLKEIIQAYLDQVGETFNRLNLLDCGHPNQRETLSRRWKQIRVILENKKRQL